MRKGKLVSSAFYRASDCMGNGGFVTVGIFFCEWRHREQQSNNEVCMRH
jgi:hypothetical protein